MIILGESRQPWCLEQQQRALHADLQAERHRAGMDFVNLKALSVTHLLPQDTPPSPS